MHGGCQLFSPILPVEIVESLLILYMHLQVCGAEEKEKNTCVLARLTSMGRGGVGRGDTM
jgi:hypothetical protein